MEKSIKEARACTVQLLVSYNAV